MRPTFLPFSVWQLRRGIVPWPFRHRGEIPLREAVGLAVEQFHQVCRQIHDLIVDHFVPAMMAFAENLADLLAAMPPIPGSAS